MKLRVRDAQAARRYKPICRMINLMMNAPKKRDERAGRGYHAQAW
jgi:ribosomal protein L13E